MGSPLPPVIPNFYMEDFEMKAIKKKEKKKPHTSPLAGIDMSTIISSSGHMEKKN